MEAAREQGPNGREPSGNSVLQTFRGLASKAAARVEEIDFRAEGWKAIAAELIRKIRDVREAAWKEMRKALAPIETQEREVREAWKPVLDWLDSLKTKLDRELARALVEEEQRQREERKRAAEAAAEAQRKVDEALTRSATATKPEDRDRAIQEGSAALAEHERAAQQASLPIEPPKVRGKGVSASASLDWKLEVADISKVPEQLTYRVVDERLALAAIRAMADRNETPAIPGLRIWSVPKASVRKAR